MRIRLKRGAAVTATAVVLAAGAVSAQAATTDHQVRRSDFISALSDTRATGAYGFGPKGLVIDTTDSANPGSGQNKVAEYYAASGALPTSGSQAWTGSQPEPGKQIVFNSGTAGDSGYNILVGEQAYDDAHNGAAENADDWWMSTGSYIYKNHHSSHSTNGTPNGTDELCPRTDVGSGTDCHGTLAEWRAAFASAAVSAYGFSLGSGVKGDGVLKSQTYGDDVYTFTDTPPATTEQGTVTPPTTGGGTVTPPTTGGGTVTPPTTGGGTTTPPAVTPESHTSKAKPTGTGKFANRNRLAVVQLKTNALPANNRGAGHISWQIRVQGVARFSSTQGFGEVQNFRWTFSKKGGSQKVEILRNGAHYKTAYVTTK